MVVILTPIVLMVVGIPGILSTGFACERCLEKVPKIFAKKNGGGEQW